MKKILIIGNSFLPLPAIEGGAIETLVDEYLKYSIGNDNFCFTVYSPYSKKVNEQDNKRYLNSEFRYIDKKSLLYRIYRYNLALKRRLFKNKTFPSAYCLLIIKDLKKRKELAKYDLVIVENGVGSLITYKRYIKSKIVEHLHNDYLNTETKNAVSIINSCDEVWCVSKFISLMVEKISNSNKTKVLYNGIDTKRFTKKLDISEVKDFRNKLNISKDDYVVLYVGRLMPEKGVLELVKAFNIAKTKNNKLKLVIVGSQRNNGRKIQQYVDMLKEESKINKNDIILYGSSVGDELLYFYNIADVQVIPSMWNEAFGLIAVEGICCNNPLIVTNSGGLLEIVNKDSALIVNRENVVQELSLALLKISLDNELSNKLVNNAKKVIKKFDYKEYNKRFDELINTILKEEGI